MKLQFNIILHVFLLLICCAVLELETARILAVFPTPSISHQIVFHPITQELARRGHEVVVITPDPAFPKGQAPVNLVEIDTHNVSYSFIVETLKREASSFDSRRKLTMVATVFFDIWVQIDKVNEILNHKRNEFDLLLVEGFIRPAACLSHLFKVPMIKVSSFGAAYQSYGIFGAPRQPYLYPASLQKRLYNLSLWEKIIGFFEYLESDFTDLEEKENEVIRKHFGDDFPPLSEIHPNTELILLNDHPIWSDNRPIPVNIAQIWGIYQKPEIRNVLPQDLQSYLDSSPQGVIYFSLGTNVKSFMLPPQKIEIMAKVLSELPYNVLWKWDVDKLPGEPKNIKLWEWFPQPDVLRHSNIKLFITQGGLQSTDDGIRAGIPLVGIPFFHDQFYNVEKYDKLNIGKFLHIEDITEESFRGAIETVIGDTMYKENVIKLREVMYDHPLAPLERVVRWTEHVLRHGSAGHLRAPAANMHWTQYYEIELVAIVATVICTALVVLVFTLRFAFRCALRALRSKLKSN